MLPGGILNRKFKMKNNNSFKPKNLIGIMEVKRVSIAFLLIFLLIFQITAVSALSASRAKEKWQEAKQETESLKNIHNEAKAKWAGTKSDENVQGYIDTGKDFLNAALDEVDAWLIWKQKEVDEDKEVPAELRNQIKSDIDENRAKVREQREIVGSANTIGGLNLVAFGMVLKYLELLTDVARDSGKILVFKSNQYIDAISQYEQTLRAEAENMENNEEVLSHLDSSKADIEEARSNTAKADIAYAQVVAGGTPIVKFNEGNQYLKTARANMISANNHLRLALRLMIQS